MPGADGTLRAMLRLEFHDEGAGKTRLELRQGPFTEAQEAVARAWWDRAFGRLDDVLAAGPPADAR